MVENLSRELDLAPDVLEFWKRVDSGASRKQAAEGLSREAVVNALGFGSAKEAADWANSLSSSLNEWSDAAIDPFSAYQRLAGEAEAREVQKRMNMGMGERRALFPEYAGRNDLIIRGLMSVAR